MILSICIPSYNRVEILVNQLDRLIPFVEKNNLIEIVVSDNCSTDDTTNVIKLKYGNKIIVNKNSENIGIVNNIKKLYELSKGKYIWFLGDDDLINIDSLEKLINILINCDLNMIYLNHNISKILKNTTSSKNFIDEKNDKLFKKGEELLILVMKIKITQLMLISAIIYKKELLKKIIYENTNIASPLSYPLKTCRNPGDYYYYSNNTFTNYQGQVSWESESLNVFTKYVPFIIIKSLFYEYGWKYNIIAFKYFFEYKTVIFNYYSGLNKIKKIIKFIKNGKNK